MEDLRESAGLDEVYGALADDSRRNMIAALSTRRLRVKDLAAVFPFSLNATSKHLKVLERAGIVERQVQGREHFFALRPKVLLAAKDWIEHCEDFGGARVEALEAVLAEGPKANLEPPESEPPFPDTPGGWLAYYRYKAKTPGEAHLSRASLGLLLGVSGATVKRWEDGSAIPAEADLRRFAGACDLSRLQTDFLARAFQSRWTEGPPEKTAFRVWATKALSVDYPCVVFDSLYFVRAWNDQFLEMFPTARLMTTPWHAVDLYRRIYDHGHPLVDLRLLVSCLREVWWRTAPYCGSPTYRRLLAGLREIPALETAWARFGDSRDSKQIGAPYSLSAATCGTYQVFTVPVSLPPTYYFRGYIPHDDQAKANRAEATSHDVYFVPAIHWAEATP